MRRKILYAFLLLHLTTGGIIALADDVSSLHRALAKGDVTVLQRVLTRSDEIFEPDFLIALWYENGSEEIRKVLDDYFESAGQEKPNMLKELLALEGKEISTPFNVPNPQFPTATSFLKDAEDPQRYSPEKAVDDKIQSSWVEGVEGPGMGECIAVKISEDISRIRIFPGYGVEKYVTLNNRLKKAYFHIYFLFAAPSEVVMTFSARKLHTYTLEFEDRMTSQTFDVSRPWEREAEGMGEYFGVLEIQEVYPGSRWDDTCVADITPAGPPKE